MKNIESNVCISGYTTIRIGGIAKWFLDVKNEDQLISTIKWAKENKINYFVIGNGSNILISDNFFNGLVIRINKQFSNIEFDNDTVTVEAGCLLSTFINKCRERSMSCLERLYGIPGTIGGSVFGNAGVKDFEIKDRIISVRVFENDLIKEYRREDCRFGYRDSLFKNKDCIILSVKFKTLKVNKIEIDYIIRDSLKFRKIHQPIDKLTLGCTFKNLNNHSAWKYVKLVENDLNFNEKVLISDKHASFIINGGNGTFKDVYNLIESIKNSVYYIYNIKLNEEIRVIDWR